MSNSFVSDISNAITNNFKKQEFNQIYNVIEDKIDLSYSSSTITDYDAAFRLQQDIILLNNILLKEVSNYINSNASRNNSGDEDEIDKNKRDTFEYQSESTKKNLLYKYLYLIIKVFVIFALLLLFYYKIVTPKDNSGSIKSNFDSSKLPAPVI